MDSGKAFEQYRTQALQAKMLGERRSPSVPSTPESPDSTFSSRGVNGHPHSSSQPPAHPPTYSITLPGSYRSSNRVSNAPSDHRESRNGMKRLKCRKSMWLTLHRTSGKKFTIAINGTPPFLPEPKVLSPVVIGPSFTVQDGEWEDEREEVQRMVGDQEVVAKVVEGPKAMKPVFLLPAVEAQRRQSVPTRTSFAPKPPTPTPPPLPHLQIDQQTNWEPPSAWMVDRDDSTSTVSDTIDPPPFRKYVDRPPWETVKSPPSYGLVTRWFSGFGRRRTIDDVEALPTFNEDQRRVSEAKRQARYFKTFKLNGLVGVRGHKGDGWTQKGGTSGEKEKPLHLPQHVTDDRHRHDDRKRDRRDRICRWVRLIILIILILFLLGNAVFLDVKSFRTSSSVSSSLTTTAQDRNVATCLSLFDLTANSSPASYPCDTCLLVLSSLPSSDPSRAKPLEFCALRSVFVNTPDLSGNTTVTIGGVLGNAGWMKDGNVCGWGGVTCGSNGRVSSLSLQAPGVPSTLPPELAVLTALATFSVIGSSSVNSTSSTAFPSGSIPTSLFPSLTSLQTLHLESTALTGTLDNSAFSAMTALSRVEIINDSALQVNVSSGLTGLKGLKTLTITGSKVSNPSVALTSLSTSSTLAATLTSLNLANAGLTGSIPSFSNFKSLQTLLLSQNSLTSIAAVSSSTGFTPSSLTSLSLSGNPQLAGSIPASTCQSGNLQSCTATGTSLTGPCSKCGL